MVASPNTDATSITIFGATGIQGGSVLRHLLQSDKAYKIRAVTRDPSKPAARKLAEQGCEVVKAELGDREEVDKAVAGQDLVFVSPPRRRGVLYISVSSLTHDFHSLLSIYS